MKKLLPFLFLQLFFLVGIANAQVTVNEKGDTITQNVDQETDQGIFVKSEDQVYGDQEFVIAQVPEQGNTIAQIWEWIKANLWPLLIGLLGFVEVVVRLTPTQKDDAWFEWLKNIIDALIPNMRKGGGRHQSA